MRDIRVLVVNNEGIAALDITPNLEGAGFKVVGQASSGEDALTLTGKENPDIVLVDTNLLGEMSSLETAAAIRETYNLPVVFHPLELQAAVEAAIYKYHVEQQLKVSQARLDTIFQSALDGIFIMNQDGRFVDVNETGCRMFGYEMDEIIGESVTLLMTESDRENMDRVIQRLWEGGVVSNRTLLHKDGSEIIIEMTVAPFNVDGEPFSLGILRDISRRMDTAQTILDSERRYRLLFEQSNDAIMIHNFDGEFLDVNNQACEMFGYTREKFLELTIRDLHPEPGDLTGAEITQSLIQQKRVHSKMKLKRLDGALLDVNIGVHVIDREKGIIQGVVRDISDQVSAEEALHGYINQLNIRHSIDRAILSARSVEEITNAALGYIRRLVKQARCAVVEFDFEDQVATVLDSLGQGTAKFPPGRKIPLDQIEISEKFKSGKMVAVKDIDELITPSPIDQEMREIGMRSYVNFPLMARDQLIGVLNIAKEHPGGFDEESMQITFGLATSLAIALQDARLNDEIKRLATIDDLTGVNNRRNLFDLGQREFERARRLGRDLTAIMLDIDHFKQVNDTYGHATGDELLREIASRCEEYIRGIDILARYGGEEFVVLLPETDLEIGLRVAERLRKAIESSPVPTEQGEMTITISLGIAAMKSNTQTLAALLDDADTAMYDAKQAGRNRVCVYQEPQYEQTE